MKESAAGGSQQVIALGSETYKKGSSTSVSGRHQITSDGCRWVGSGHDYSYLVRRLRPALLTTDGI